VVGGDLREGAVQEEGRFMFRAVSNIGGGEPDRRVMLRPKPRGQVVLVPTRSMTDTLRLSTEIFVTP
jgi:hypothetical protein